MVFGIVAPVAGEMVGVLYLSSRAVGVDGLTVYFVPEPILDVTNLISEKMITFLTTWGAVEFSVKKTRFEVNMT